MYLLNATIYFIAESYVLDNKPDVLGVSALLTTTMRMQAEVIEALKKENLRDDLKVFVLTHAEEISDNFKPKRKIKTIGKLVDNSLTMEGLFTIVLFTDTSRNDDGTINYRFQTNNDGTCTAKSPEGMFFEYIENDLGLVAKAVDEYYG